MKKHEWLFICVAVLFSAVTYSSSVLADTDNQDQSTDQAAQTTESSTVQSSDETTDSSTDTGEATTAEDDQVVKQVIHVQKIISSEQLNNQGSKVEKQSGVNGAQFVEYDVTDILQKMDTKGKQVDQIESQLKERVKKLSKDQLKKVVAGETKTVDQQDGVFEFTAEGPANQKKAYYIVNESSPDNISNSEDILLLTPASNENGEILSDIWIYPKSEASQPKEEVKKIVSTGVKKNLFQHICDYFTHLFSKK